MHSEGQRLQDSIKLFYQMAELVATVNHASDWPWVRPPYQKPTVSTALTVATRYPLPTHYALIWPWKCLPDESNRLTVPSCSTSPKI